MTPSGVPRPVRTSLLLEIFLYFGRWYDVVFFVLEVLIFIWKALNLPFPPNNFGLEFAYFWLLFFIVEPTRLFLSSKGNLTESRYPLLFALVINLPVIVLHFYYIFLQTYVLRIEIILNAIALGFIGMQSLLGVAAVLTFRQ